MPRKKIEEIKVYNSTISQNKYKQYNCFYCNQKGHIFKSSPAKIKDEVEHAQGHPVEIAEGNIEVNNTTQAKITKNKNMVLCFKCQEYGHFANKYPSKKQGQPKDGSNGYLIPGVHYAPEITLNILSINLLKQQARALEDHTKVEEDSESLKPYQWNIGRKITINGSDTAGYDKTKVECFNFHKMGYFAKECRSPRSQESRPKNQDNSRKTVIVEDTSSKAMVTIDGAGFDWSYMADNEVPTNIALMTFSDSEVHNSKTFSNTCLKSFETLKNQYDNLRIELNKSEFDLANNKRGLAYVEEQLFFYKKIEVVFCDQIIVLKRDASFRESDIIALNLQLEKLKKEKESNQIKIDNFEKASKSLDKLIGSQITDNSKTGLGFWKRMRLKRDKSKQKRTKSGTKREA
nr:ARID DNA-binding domain-containing protein [Tanacetum cinerariifolium]